MLSKPVSHPPNEVRTDGMETQSTEYLEVLLRQQLPVGLPAQEVAEVLGIQPDQICPIPGVNHRLLGVIHWRGRLLWTVNLSDFLSLRRDPQASSPLKEDVSALGWTAVVLAHPQEDRHLACVVARLQGLVTVGDRLIQPVPEQFPPQIHTAFRGVVQRQPPLLLLDTQRLLTSTGWPLRSPLKVLSH